MSLQILEIASMNLKGNLKANDERLLSIFRICLDGISEGGGKYFRFLTNTPTNQTLEKPIVTIIGIWPSAELHSAFIASGKLTSLLSQLGDLISMREVVYLQVPPLNSVQISVLEGDLVIAFFQVSSKNHHGFDEAAKSIIGKVECVTGWSSTQGENLKSSEEFRKGRSDQEHSDAKHEGVWGILVGQKDRGVVDEIKSLTAQKHDHLEALTWNALDC